MTRTFEKAYTYPDAKGDVLLRKARYYVDPPGADGRNKAFVMYGRSRPDGAVHTPLRHWYIKHPELESYWHGLLYGLPQLLKVLRDHDADVWSVEGERDVDTATDRLGLIAVSHWQGAVNSTLDQAAWFKGFRGRVPLAVDNDGSGAADAVRRYDQLIAVGLRPNRIRLVQAAAGVTCQNKHGQQTEEHADFTDHINAGLGIDALQPVALPLLREVAATWTRERGERDGYRR
jgi:hypothetical protein